LSISILLIQTYYISTSSRKLESAGRDKMSDIRPWGYGWRSSQAFIIFTATLGLFSETFLYAFIVPILSYMIEVRLRLPPAQTQRLTTALLTTHGFVSVVSAPVIAHFADKTSNRKLPLLIALVGCLVGTFLLAICPSGMYQHILYRQRHGVDNG
jgi:MFS family permease